MSTQVPINPATGRSAGAGDPRADQRVSPRAVQELGETIDRSRLGGPFYVLAWMLGGMAADLPQRAPLAFMMVAAVFVAFAVLRLRLRPLGEDATPRAVQQRLDRLWAMVLVNSALWGAGSAWLLAGSSEESARTVVAVSSFAFSTAFAHNFSMRRRRALAAIVLLYVPTMVAYLLTAVRYEFVVIGLLYLVYVIMALHRSHAEYLQRLNLEDALRAERDRFEQQSQRDDLTGLVNRRRFSAVLRQWMEPAVSTTRPFALLILDLDWFKSINDRHGHAVGDACLRAFAAELQQAFADGVVARLGGEEFAVLLSDCGPAAATRRAESFRCSVAGQPLSTGDLALGLTVSIGVGAYDPRRHPNTDALYREVDAALYRAKASGRNAVCEVDRAVA